MKNQVLSSCKAAVLGLGALIALCTQLRAQVLDLFQPVINHRMGLQYARVVQFAVQPDGAILMSGDFTELDGQAQSHLGRVNSDGSLDTTFHPPNQINGQWLLALLGDGKIITGSGGLDPLKRCLPDGSPDYTFPFGVSDGNLTGMAVFPDGRIAFDNQIGPAVGTIRLVSPSGERLYDVPILGSAATLTAQPDGKLLVGGSFTSLAGQARTTLARLNGNGTLDTSFSTNFSGSVEAMLLQPDGSILIGGDFTIQGAARRLARLSANGELDPSFNANFAGSARSMALQADGKLIVVGRPSSCAFCGTIVRFHSDGTLDTSFAPAPNALVFGVAIEPSGGVLLGGDFTQIAGQGASKIARVLNTEPATQSLTFGTSTATWLRGGTSPEVWTTRFESSTNGVEWALLGVGTYVGAGWQINGVSIPAAACVRARGYITSGFANAGCWFVETIAGPPVIAHQPPSQTNLFGTTVVLSVDCVGTSPFSYQWRKNGEDLQDSGKISGVQSSTLSITNLAGDDAGMFSVVITNASGSVTSLLASLTVLDPVIIARSFQPVVALGDPIELSATAEGTPPLAYVWRKNGTVLPGATDSSLKITTNAQFSHAGEYSVTVSNVFGEYTAEPMRVAVTANYPDSLDAGLIAEGPPGVLPAVTAIAVQTDGRILIGGAFSSPLGGAIRGFVRLQPDGSPDASLQFGPDSFVPSAIILPDQRILVAPSWSMNLPFLSRYLPGGGLDASFELPPGFIWDVVYPMVRQPDGTISFVFHTGPISQFQRLKPDGMLDTNFTAEVWEHVNSMAAQPDGKVLVGGLVYKLGEEFVTNLGRFNADGTVDTSFRPQFLYDGDWTQAGIGAVAVQEDGKIIATGMFNEVAGKPCQGIVRLNPDGTADAGFNASVPYDDWGIVSSIALQADGRIILGGSLTSLNGQPVSQIGRLNPDGSLDPSFNPGADGPVLALTLQPDGRVLVGGDFSMVGGKPRAGFARLLNTGPATQTLSYSGSTLRWVRGGTAPAVWATWFESSSDGTNWTTLGQGSRVDGGWEVAGVNAAPGTQLRARGWVAGGARGASGWFVESSIAVEMPIILSSLQKEPFGFTVSGSAGSTVVIEGSTDLQNWIPLKTNLIPEAGAVPFLDPDSAVNTQRFYRARASLAGDP